MSVDITDRQLQAYRNGRLDAESDAAIEELLMTDPALRSRLGALASAPRLDELWFDIDNELDRPVPGRLERMAGRLGASEPAGRLAGATPSLTRAWSTALGALAVLSLLVSSDAAQGTNRFAGYLLISPLALLGAVAVAYRRSAEPAHEVAVAAPIGGIRLLIWRAAAVAPVAAVVNIAVGLILGGRWFAIAWLLPGLALTSLALALSATYSMTKSTVIVTVGWLAVMAIVAGVATDDVIAFRAPAQLLWLVLTAIGGAALWARRDELEEAVRW